MSANDSDTAGTPGPQEVIDSPSDWVADHIRAYVESDGEEGHEWQGVPTLLLSMKGRKSGLWRRTALIYGRDGDAYVVVASKGGAANHPLWFLNLRDNPEAEVQVGPDRFRVRAREAEGEERARMWETMAAIWPDYNNYQTKTERRIPVVVLDPIS
ncbi:nitroreductase family deazaflavin-dependent oxidoreductase [Actinocrinis puniceicyclus]|uniref:nitroreductase family deazaflavin-dependent oxidoreductase n=1 Tax=Actinocrinis puniceicyclus TaxID=977794 RepID=UPI001B8D4920|nr:nitroreductase family deazaflavin-dependent oxidoreductase [Actinocrinis puniceicyclus]